MAVNFHSNFVDPSQYEYKKSPFVLDESIPKSNPNTIKLPGLPEIKIGTPPFNPNTIQPSSKYVCYMA